jgi:hypothetical protein
MSDWNAQIIEEFRAKKQGSVPDDDVKELTDALARCDAAIARLEAA